MKGRIKYLLTAACVGTTILMSGCTKTQSGTAGQIDISANDHKPAIDEGISYPTENPKTSDNDSESVKELRAPVESVSLEKNSIVLEKGETVTIKAEILPADASDKSIRWKSLNPEIAEVDDNGQLTAVSGGSAKIIAFAEGKSAVCSVSVKVSLRSIGVNDMKIDIADGQTPLIWSFEPEDVTETHNVSFKSSDTGVVTIDADGNLKPVAVGTAYITVRAGLIAKKCRVTVIRGLRELSFSDKQAEAELGKTVKLDVVTAPKELTEKPELVFTSSAPEIISVDKNGVCTANKKGSAVITVTCGEIKAECTVSTRIPLEGIKLDSDNVSLVKGQGLKLGASLLPGDTTDKTAVSFTSSNPLVASVTADGSVTALAPGMAVITAAANGYKADCSVSVTSPLQSISLSAGDITLWKGETSLLSVGFIPEDTTDKKTVTFKSSNSLVAAVDNNGLVTALGDGSCTITAVSSGCSASCIVRVKTFIHVSGIALNAPSLEMNTVGQTYQLTAQISPTGATNPAVTYQSSNPRVASVSQTGLVTAISGGGAVIIATADGVSASCTVTVNLPQVKKVVVLDPGHGGVDPGAGANGQFEKDMTLKVALYAKQYLEQNYSGVTVLLTRDSDTQLARDETNTDLRARCYFAASVGADCMVSLHFNTSAAHNAQGALVLISKQPAVTAACAGLGSSILNQLQALGIRNRGNVITESTTLADANGYLDYYAINRISATYGMPGIIVEHCFMDNAGDAAYCSTDSALYNLAVADAVGIASYLGLTGK